MAACSPVTDHRPQASLVLGPASLLAPPQLSAGRPPPSAARRHSCTACSPRNAGHRGSAEGCGGKRWGWPGTGAGPQVLGWGAGPAQDLAPWRPQCAVAPLESNKEQRVRGGATSPAHTRHAHKCISTKHIYTHSLSILFLNIHGSYNVSVLGKPSEEKC